ncbi:transcription termination/antitermination NusG family protein [Adlercreutzia sp. ZJ304]|uniref:transcription termination/antitermination protein NusG n=1 Tax=Adlercreutzia sp. ZJ304 TaxID=2709791 RepID=UPI0013ED77F0|nr:transcription termination/antitermination NusG family protein [Adlercreutzia sp. ZJ304]
MWFAINVKQGCEQEALSLLRGTAAADSLQELFVPSAVTRTVRGGKMVESAEPLIPGVVVAVAPGRHEVRAALRHARGVDEVLTSRPGAAQMADAEVALIDALTRPGCRVVGFSEGFVGKGGEVTVINGPLCGHEDLIRRISHRGKRAYVHMSVAGHEVEARMGLRVTRQREGAAMAKAGSRANAQTLAPQIAVAATT